MEKKDTTYKVKEVAEMLSIHKGKVLLLIHTGKLRAVNVSTGDKRPTWRIPNSDLQRFLAERESQITTNG